MTKKVAQNIGVKLAIKAVTLGILLAYLIPTLFFVIGGGISAALWVFEIDYWTNIVGGVAITYACGYFSGKKAGNEILIKRKDHQKVGAKYGFLTLLVTAFLVGWIGFLQEGVVAIGTNDNPFYDYIYKPMFWILLFGFLPSILVGLLFGKWIKAKQEIIT